MIRSQASPHINRISATINDTVMQTGISRSQLYRLAGAGRIKLVKCGRTTLVDWDSIQGDVASLPSAELRQAA